MDCARNIITANFSGGGTSATTAPLWQWDYGQVLCITGIDLPAAFEVHFSTNRTGGVSTTAVGADGQVTIPNVLLTIGKNLNAWIYLSDAQGEGETEYSILIPVKARPMPETYDAEVSGEFDDVVRQVSEYAQTAQTAADNAGASASAAATSASEAAASASAAETAKNAAEIAQGKAEDAQAAAETAAQTATEKAQQTAQDAAQAALDAGRAESAAGRAEAAETGAESAKTDAETAAQGAAASASAASASATSAGQAATSAGQSATAAAGSATTAQSAAQTATTKAGEASASASAANTAKTAAQTAQTAAETAASTATASATTATTKAAEAAQSASNAAASETAAEAAATRAETAAASLTVDSALSDTSTNPVQNKVITGEVAQVKSHLGAVEIVDTASGAIATFPDGSDGVPVESLTVSIEPIQDLHGQDAPYPAGGGKNLLDYSGAAVNRNSTEFKNISLTANQAYTFSYYGTSTVTFIGYVHETSERVFTSGYTHTYTYTPETDIVIDLICYDSSGVTSAANLFQMEKGTTSTSYAPYSNICPISGRDSVTVWREASYDPSADPALTIQLGDTVYGGTLDVVSGELVVDRAKKTLSQNDSFTLSQSATRNRITWNGYESVGKIGGLFVSNALKSMPASSGGYGTSDWEIWGSTVAPRCWISVPLSYTIDDFKEFLSSDPIEIVYELATPITYHLTPQEVRTLLGQNNVWSNGDSVTVEYVADPKLYIDKKITAAVAALA